MSILDDLGQAVGDVVAVVRPSVVRVGANLRGCGIVVGEQLVLTSAHNLRGAETTLTLPDRSRITATVAGTDLDGDLAVLRILVGAASPMEWSTTELSTGQAVVALGAGAGPDLGASLGFVTGTGHAFRGPGGRRITGAIEHSAPLPRGSSGGPLVDAKGRLVGVNTHRLGDGFYLAVPVSAELRARVDELAAGIEPQRHRLGVGLAPAEVARRLRRQVGLPSRDGLLVRDVLAGGAAARADIRPGDLLVSAASKPLATVDDLHAALDAAGAEPRVVFGVVRGADELEVTVAFDGSGIETQA